MRLAFLLAIVAVGLPLGLLDAAPIPPQDNRAAEQAIRQAGTALDEVRRPVGVKRWEEGDTASRIELWCTVADLHRKLGKSDAARDAVKKAMAIAEEYLALRRYDQWPEIAKAFGRLGDAKSVIELAAAVPMNINGKPIIRCWAMRSAILCAGALAAAEVGLDQTAKELIDNLSGGWEKDQMRSAVRHRLLIHQAKTGDVAGAIRGANALPTADEQMLVLVGTGFNALFFGDCDTFTWNEGIATVQLAAGDLVGAKETALKCLALLPDIAEGHRSGSALALVRVFAKLDDLPSARKALAHIPHPKPQSATPMDGRVAIHLNAKSYMASAEVRAGRDDVAKSLALDFTSPGQQAYVLQFVGLAQARAGRKDAAKATFARIAELLSKSGKDDVTGSNWYLLASSQSLAGDLAGASKSAERANDPTASSNLAFGHADAGDFDSARKMIADLKLLNSHTHRFVTTQALAAKQARAGQVQAVQEWADTEEDKLLKACILVGLAEGLYKELPKAPTKK